MPATKTPAPVYRATRNRNGTFNIHDVPIMSLLDTGAAGQETEIDEAWLRAAVKRAQERERRDHYLAPLHVHHHDDGEQVSLIGFMRLRRVGDYTYDGQQTKAVFADLVGIKPEVFERIRKLELPYRSVEILDARRTEIDSLALLAHHTPFFRFALLRVAEAGPASGEAADGFALVQTRAGRRLLLARRGSRYAMLCSADRREVKMADKAKKPDDEKDEVAAADEPDVSIDVETDENKADDVAAAADGGGVEAKLDRIIDMLSKLVGGGDDAAVAPGMGDAPAEPEAMAAAFAARRAKAPKASAREADEIVRLRAENAALKLGQKRDAATDAKRRATDALIARAKAALADYDLDAQDVKDITALAAHGPKAVDAFVEAIRRRSPSDPAGTLDEALAEADTVGLSTPASAMLRERSLSPDKLGNAQKAHADWMRLRKNGSRASFESFVEANADIYGLDTTTEDAAL